MTISAILPKSQPYYHNNINQHITETFYSTSTRHKAMLKALFTYFTYTFPFIQYLQLSYSCPNSFYISLKQCSRNITRGSSRSRCFPPFLYSSFTGAHLQECSDSAPPRIQGVSPNCLFLLMVLEASGCMEAFVYTPAFLIPFSSPLTATRSQKQP